jgi:succinate dehydrogenase/fumarate reductase flavoprotein subunit
MRLQSGAESVTTDVVVVGAGAAGLSAALGASATGCDVIVLEGAPAVGGTTLKSSGGVFIPNNSFLREQGVADEREDAVRFMARVGFPEAYDAGAERFGLEPLDYELITTYYDEASGVVETLVAQRVLTLAPMLSISRDPRGFPSYHSELPEEKVPYGRTLNPQDWAGVEGYGVELIGQLATGVQRRGVRLFADHLVVGVLESGGEVVGVEVDTPEGRQQVLARRGVVFATGGFTHNVELVEEHLPGFVPGGGAASSAQGAFVAFAQELGAELAHMDTAWWAQLPVELALESREQPLLLFVPTGDSMIIVDANGRRVVNEKDVYHDRGKAHFVRDAGGGLPNKLLFMIYDQALVDAPPYHTRWPIPPAGEHAHYVIEAPTLAALQQGIAEHLERIAEHTGGFGLQPGFGEQLPQTIATFNGYAERGVDPDFHRGDRAIERDWGGPGRTGFSPNITMYPIAPEGPYYCMILAAATLDTSGGPRIDPQGRVLRPDGSAIAGLYGAGNCIASPSGSGYWSGGGTLGPAVVFGYLAGRAAGERTADAAQRGSASAAPAGRA